MRVIGDDLPLSDHPSFPANETHVVATAENIREEDSNPCSGDEISTDEYIEVMKSVSMKRDEDFVDSASIATDAAVCHDEDLVDSAKTIREEDSKPCSGDAISMDEYIELMKSFSMKRDEDLVDSASIATDAAVCHSKKPRTTKSFVSKSCEKEEDIALAKRNYEAFHSLPKGSATTGILIGSSVGIAGWASCKIEEPQQCTEDRQDEEAEILVMIAKQNYETFHSLSPGSVTLEMLENSLAGIAGWAKIACASNLSTRAPSHRRSPSMVNALQSSTPTKAPSQDLAALEAKRQEQEQQYMLLSYEKDFYKDHNRQVSSFKDIKLEELAGPAGLLQTPSNQKGDKNMDSLEAVNYDDAKHNQSDTNVGNTSSPTRRRGDEEEALHLRFELLESVGAQVDYGAKLLSLSRDGIDDNVDIFCDCDSEAQDEGQLSEDDDPEKWEQNDSTKVAKPLPKRLTTGSSDAEIAKTDQKSPSPPAENIIASSEDEVDKPSETGLSPRIESICLDSSEDDMDIASQGSVGSFVVVPTQEECDSSASTRSGWSVV
jgi:hypothetical protein